MASKNTVVGRVDWYARRLGAGECGGNPGKDIEHLDGLTRRPALVTDAAWCDNARPQADGNMPRS